jgi:uncharacterized protein YprB with RNaseH-like and TPR domain
LTEGGAFEDADFLTLRRTVYAGLSRPLDPVFPETLFAIVPGLAGRERSLTPEDLVFFDLETTGLSGGAGTVAFLAAFGRFEEGIYDRVKIDQYLLLDYPGEAFFLRQILQMFGPRNSAAGGPAIVSYNGKSFDSQIIGSRYLIHGMRPPPFCHADLLYTARSLWKKTLPSCSQGEIEKSILKIDRDNDIPGCRAPDIWFSFLKTNDASELSRVCDHNVRDIAGLASMLAVINTIACDPVLCAEKYGADAGALALRIRKYRRVRADAPQNLLETENALLEKAALGGSSLAAFLLGKALMRSKGYVRARLILGSLAEKKDGVLSVLADRALAIDSEWRLKDFERALFHTERALSTVRINDSLKTDMMKRRERLRHQRGALFSAALTGFERQTTVP